MVSKKYKSTSETLVPFSLFLSTEFQNIWDNLGISRKWIEFFSYLVSIASLFLRLRCIRFLWRTLVKRCIKEHAQDLNTIFCPGCSEHFLIHEKLSSNLDYFLSVYENRSSKFPRQFDIVVTLHGWIPYSDKRKNLSAYRSLLNPNKIEMRKKTLSEF